MSEAVNIARLRQTLRLPTRVIRGSVLDAFPHRQYDKRFRFCRKCLGRGYHSTLHQLQCESVCPAHQKPLEVGCRRCGYEPLCLLNARFLETPFLMRLLRGTLQLQVVFDATCGKDVQGR